jgi:hypothetical protein
MDGSVSARERHDEGRDATAERRVRIELARRDDEPELRRLLRENRMRGEITVSLEREPDYFLAAGIEGPRHHSIVARDTATGRLVGVGSRSVRPSFVDGQTVMLPYLGSLRVDGNRRGRGRLLSGGYEVCRSLRRPDETPYAITSIIADNRPARRLLEAGLPRLPRYDPIDSFSTVVIPTRGSRRRPRPSADRGADEDLEGIAERLQEDHRRRQFAPRWTTEDLRSNERTPGLEPHDFHIVRRGGEIAACLAVWDQRSFKQAVVREYGKRLRRARPWLNLLERWLGVPRLPAPGHRLECAFISHVAAGDDPDLLVALVESARRDAAHRGCDSVIVGFSQRSPMLGPLLREFRHRVYRSVVYLVHWDDVEGGPRPLSGRAAHLEVATL